VDCPRLRYWDHNTLETGPDGKLYFTAASDLYQLGVMLSKLLHEDRRSEDAKSCLQMLLSKKHPTRANTPLDAATALKHKWFKPLVSVAWVRGHRVATGRPAC
jgi:hypothetical protein